MYKNLSKKYSNIDISKIEFEEANALGVEIKNIEITKELHGKIKIYIYKYDFYYERSNVRSGNDISEIFYTSKFTLSETHNRNKKSTYFVRSYTNSLLNYPSLQHLTNKHVEDLILKIQKDHSIILSALQIFYGILKKYPNHIHNVTFDIHGEKNEEIPPLIQFKYSVEKKYSTNKFSSLNENGPYKDFYDDLSDKSNRDLYLSDGIWITPDGELEDRGH